MRNRKQIAKIFRDFATKIEDNTCGVDQETLNSIASMMIHIKLTSEEACSFLGVSRATLTRMQWDGRIPKAHKESGGKEYWYKDELETYIRNNKK